MFESINKIEMQPDSNFHIDAIRRQLIPRRIHVSVESPCFTSILSEMESILQLVFSLSPLKTDHILAKSSTSIDDVHDGIFF